MASIRELADEAVRLGLDGADAVSAFTDEELATMYNGTGPAFLPDSIRGALDKAAKPFLPAIMVHDGDFEDSDGTVKSFNAANKRLLVNCIICATDAAPWYSWQRYALIAEAWTIYRACNKFGWIAWLSAYRDNQQDKE